MARTTIQIPYTCSFDDAQSRVERILTLRGFHQQALVTGETVWKHGLGLMTAMKYVKVEYGEKMVTLSAWVQVGIGSIGGGEMALTGITAALPKKQLMKVLEEIQRMF